MSLYGGFMIDNYLNSIKQNIPECIKDLNIFLCYDDRDKPSYINYTDKRIDELKKKPRDLRGIPYSINSRCFTFNECIESIENGFNSGIGIVVDNDLIGLDLDNCVKGIKKLDKFGLEIPILSKEVQEIINQLENTYIEISQSGKGLHCLFYSSIGIPRQTKKPLEIEIYSKKNHFMRLSGNVINSTPYIEILDKTDVLLNIYSKYFDIKDSKQVNDTVIKNSTISFRDDDFKKQFNGLSNKYDEEQILNNLFSRDIFYYKLYNNELTSKDINEYNKTRNGRGLLDTSNSGLSVLLILNLIHYSYGDMDMVYSLFKKSKLYKKEYDTIKWRAKNLTKLDMIVNYCKSRYKNFKIEIDEDLTN